MTETTPPALRVTVMLLGLCYSASAEVSISEDFKGGKQWPNHSELSLLMDPRSHHFQFHRAGIDWQPADNFGYFSSDGFLRQAQYSCMPPIR